MTENITAVNKRGVVQLRKLVMRLNFNKAASSTEIIFLIILFVFPVYTVATYQICS